MKKEPARRKPAFLKQLEELDKKDLIAEIEQLCARFDVVKQYFEIELSGDTSKYLDKAKNEISKQFYTSAGRPRNPKASRLNKIIKDFEQISFYKEDIIILMIHRIEQTVTFSHKFGISEALYQSTNRAIGQVMQLIEEEGLEEKYLSNTELFQNLS